VVSTGSKPCTTKHPGRSCGPRRPMRSSPASPLFCHDSEH
jgi:hypothetical protein